MFTQAILQFTPLVVGSLSGISTKDEINTWYRHLNEPVIKPPNWLFGPVWTSLYLMMGYASTRIYNSNHVDSTMALYIYGGQLLLNFLWTPLFFGKHWLGISLMEIVAMDIAVIYTISKFIQIDKLSGQLLFPYLAWISFATVLNFEYWRLNRTKSK